MSTDSAASWLVPWYVHRPAACSAPNSGKDRSAPSMAATTHSAVDASCAPRALHSATDGGTSGRIQSTPAVSAWITRSAGIWLSTALAAGLGKKLGT